MSYSMATIEEDTIRLSIKDIIIVGSYVMMKILVPSIRDRNIQQATIIGINNK
jgi:hypothetical protein